MAKKRMNELKMEQVPPPLAEPRYLSGSCIYLHQNSPENMKLTVPPTSPKQLIYDYPFTSLPDLFPKVNDLKLPYVREVGIKASIKQLAEYFQCMDYKFNLIQFWFLDIITDCLWRAQDEFQFPEEHQKIILEWILYIFNLIRAPQLNLTRNKLFKLFKEAMLIAEDYIESGCSAIPLPEELFALNLEQGENEGQSYTLNSSGSSTSSASTMSLDSGSEAGSYVAVKFQQNTELFKLPTKPCPWVASDDECLSTSVETVSEEEKPIVEDTDEIDTPEEQLTSSNEDMEFYKEPDLKKIPPRFMPSHESLGDTISISVETETIEEIPDDGKDSEWVDIPHHPPKPDCPSQLTISEDDEGTSKTEEEEVMHAWFDYYVWQQRLEDMDNPNKGWVSQIHDNEDKSSNDIMYPEETDRIDTEKLEWLNFVKEKEEEIRNVEKNIFINSCALLVIKQFVFEYFYETFPFTLLKLALGCPHSLITQEVNDKWYVPKMIKSELKKPKPKKPKKEKIPKEKKEKTAKPKQEKPKKEKSSKEKSAKSKKEKPKKLTKEEKAELAKLKKEQELLEEAKRKEEENKFFMFPLAEAATDDFFKSIFTNWVKVEKKDKGKKKK